MRLRVRLSACLPLVLAVLVGSAGCHEEGDVQVASLVIEGNHAFTDAQLREAIVTQPSGKLPWARKRFFSRQTFDQDLVRLKAFYDDHGYPRAQVSSIGADLNASKTAIDLRIQIDEGAPMLVEAVEIRGLEGLAADLADRLRALPIKEGVPRDRQLVAAGRERATFLLHDGGYPHARVTSTERPGAAADRVVIEIAVDAGPMTHVGGIDVRGTRTVAESVVLRSLAFKPGDLYRETQVIESQRRLRALGIFDFAHVGIDPERAPSGEAVPIVATVNEGKPQRFQLGGGYGSEDGPRGSFQWQHLNFLGDARQFTLDTKYSRRLRGMGIEFLEPYFLASRLTNRLSANARLGGWWAVEPTYRSRSIGGRLGVTFRASGRRHDLEPRDSVVRVAYANESLNYTITESALADLTNVDQLIGLGLDPVTGQGSGRLTSIEVEFERTAVSSELDPHRGHTATLKLKQAAPWLGGTFRYREVLGEGRLYIPLGARLVWATRGRAGAIYSATAADVPFSQRYFLGGSSSLRGWGRFQVAPLTDEGLPIGGRAILDVSTELRFPLWGAFGGVMFVDAGNVWDESTRVRLGDLVYDAGPGVRYTSPIGIIRADFGYQLRRIPGLLVNGAPEARRWRVHFSIGHAF